MARVAPAELQAWPSSVYRKERRSRNLLQHFLATRRRGLVAPQWGHSAPYRRGLAFHYFTISSHDPYSQ